MRKYNKHRNILLVIFSFVIVLSGCKQQMTNENVMMTQENSSEKDHRELDNKTNKLVIWSDIDLGKEHIEKFKKQAPGVEIEIKEWTLDQQLDGYMDGLVDKSPADLYVIDSSNLGNFGTIDGFEDLSKPPYNAEQYKKDIDPMLWRNHLTIQDKKLFAFPIGMAPLVTFYREDILKEYGFPSDPEELATFMEEPKNWIALGEELGKNQKSIAQWEDDPFLIYNLASGMFDENYNSKLTESQFLNAYRLMQEVRDRSMHASKSVWTDVGQEAIRSDEIVMLYLGSWGEHYLQEWAPETKGKWKVTRLPFGLNAWDSSTSIAIPKHSENKEQAWKFIEFTFKEGLSSGYGPLVSANISNRNNKEKVSEGSPILGGQKSSLLYIQLLDKIDIPNSTPFFSRGYNLLLNKVYSGINTNKEPEDIYKEYLDSIEKEFGRERDLYLEYQK